MHPVYFSIIILFRLWKGVLPFGTRCFCFKCLKIMFKRKKPHTWMSLVVHQNKSSHCIKWLLTCLLPSSTHHSWKKVHKMILFIFTFIEVQAKKRGKDRKKIRKRVHKQKTWPNCCCCCWHESVKCEYSSVIWTKRQCSVYEADELQYTITCHNLIEIQPNNQTSRIISFKSSLNYTAQKCEL